MLHTNRLYWVSGALFALTSAAIAQSYVSNSPTIATPSAVDLHEPVRTIDWLIRQRPPIQFTPFEMLDPHTGMPVHADDKIEVNGVIMRAGDYYYRLNRMEQWLNAYGYSLRTDESIEYYSPQLEQESNAAETRRCYLDVESVLEGRLTLLGDDESDFSPAWGWPDYSDGVRFETTVGQLDVPYLGIIRTSLLADGSYMFYNRRKPVNVVFARAAMPLQIGSYSVWAVEMTAYSNIEIDPHAGLLYNASSYGAYVMGSEVDGGPLLNNGSAAQTVIRNGRWEIPGYLKIVFTLPFVGEQFLYAKVGAQGKITVEAGMEARLNNAWGGRSFSHYVYVKPSADLRLYIVGYTRFDVFRSFLPVVEVELGAGFDLLLMKGTAKATTATSIPLMYFDNGAVCYERYTFTAKCEPALSTLSGGARLVTRLYMLGMTLFSNYWQLSDRPSERLDSWPEAYASRTIYPVCSN
jgi:hypothetical protein